MLAIRGVGRGAQVVDGRVVGERDERVPESLGDVDGLALRVIEQTRVPPAERRGADSDVDDDVEHSAAHAGDVLGLARRDVREVDAADTASPADRRADLGNVEAMADSLFDRRCLVRLEETCRGRPCAGGV